MRLLTHSSSACLVVRSWLMAWVADAITFQPPSLLQLAPRPGALLCLPHSSLSPPAECVQRKCSNAFAKPSDAVIYRITIQSLVKELRKQGVGEFAQASLDLQYVNSTRYQKWHGRSSQAPTCAAPLKCGEDLTVLWEALSAFLIYRLGPRAKMLGSR